MTPLLLEANATDTSWVPGAVAAAVTGGVGVLMICLLYTSDAADE